MHVDRYTAVPGLNQFHWTVSYLNHYPVETPFNGSVLSEQYFATDVIKKFDKKIGHLRTASELFKFWHYLKMYARAARQPASFSMQNSNSNTVILQKMTEDMFSGNTFAFLCVRWCCFWGVAALLASGSVQDVCKASSGIYVDNDRGAVN